MLLGRWSNVVVTPAQKGHDSLRESRFYGGESGKGEPVVFTNRYRICC